MTAEEHHFRLHQPPCNLLAYIDFLIMSYPYLSLFSFEKLFMMRTFHLAFLQLEIMIMVISLAYLNYGRRFGTLNFSVNGGMNYYSTLK